MRRVCKRLAVSAARYHNPHACTTLAAHTRATAPQLSVLPKHNASRCRHHGCQSCRIQCCSLKVFKDIATHTNLRAENPRLRGHMCYRTTYCGLSKTGRRPLSPHRTACNLAAVWQGNGAQTVQSWQTRLAHQSWSCAQDASFLVYHHQHPHSSSVA